MMTIQHSEHSAYRCAQRGLSKDDLEYIYFFGSRYHSAGALICFLRRKDVPLPDRRRDYAMRLVGSALVINKYGYELVTAWRNRRRGMKVIRRKEH